MAPTRFFTPPLRDQMGDARLLPPARRVTEEEGWGVAVNVLYDSAPAAMLNVTASTAGTGRVAATAKSPAI